AEGSVTRRSHRKNRRRRSLRVDGEARDRRRRQGHDARAKLKVKEGLATIKAGSNADGAKVLLVSGSERRPVPSLPLRVDITSDKPYSIVASKKGFSEYRQNIVFED